MTASFCIVILGVGLAAALSPVPHHTSEESLRSALNAVTRKQRSLDGQTGQYYREPQQRGQQVPGTDEIDVNEEALAFIPVEAAGQLETIGDGYQHLNNKQLGRALMDYFKYTTEQQDQGASQSMFRERERSGSRKRGSGSGGRRLSGKELIRLLEDAENDVSEDQGPLSDEEYQRTLEMIYDKYKNQADDELYGSEQALQQYDGLRQLLLSKLLAEEAEREEEEQEEEDGEPRYGALPSAERRNVNARYPLFTREYKNYRDFSKRFPVAKRSPKAVNRKRQTTDPKVAQELGSLFGGEASAPAANRTGQEHSGPPTQEVERKPAEHVHGAAAVLPSSVTMSKDLNKTKERPIEVKKKSVDWSQYFGIDRRKKKAVYAGRPATQEQDEEYLLQKYYEIMAENLNPVGKDADEKRDKLQQIDSKLRNMKNLMLEEAVQLSAKGNMDNQELKDEIISRQQAAYSLEKLRRALNELSTSAAAHRESQKSAQAQNNLTANHPDTGAPEDKRNRVSAADALYQGVDDTNCPEIELIERHCKAAEERIGDFRQATHIPCVMYHMCSSCGEDECLERFAVDIEHVCEIEEVDEGLAAKKRCVQAAMLLTRSQPSRPPRCREDEDETACLIRYLGLDARANSPHRKNHKSCMCSVYR